MEKENFKLRNRKVQKTLEEESAANSQNPNKEDYESESNDEVDQYEVATNYNNEETESDEESEKKDENETEASASEKEEEENQGKKNGSEETEASASEKEEEENQGKKNGFEETDSESTKRKRVDEEIWSIKKALDENATKIQSKSIELVDCPQQPCDSSDCAIYVMKFLEDRSNDHDIRSSSIYDPEDAKVRRATYAYELISDLKHTEPFVDEETLKAIEEAVKHN